MPYKKTIKDRYLENNYILDNEVIRKQHKSDERQRSRLKQRTEKILEQPYQYFFTYTLNDYSLENTTQSQHIKKIKGTLPTATLYLINNDYGAKTDRLHYHALASFNYEYDTTLLDKWQYGYTSIRPITTPDPLSLYRYIMKLTNHHTKSSVAKIWRSRKNVRTD
jgi:hypothetical protein